MFTLVDSPHKAARLRNKAKMNRKRLRRERGPAIVAPTRIAAMAAVALATLAGAKAEAKPPVQASTARSVKQECLDFEDNPYYRAYARPNPDYAYLGRVGVSRVQADTGKSAGKTGRISTPTRQVVANIVG